MQMTLELLSALVVVLLLGFGLLSITGLMFLQGGLVRARNTNDILIKNLSVFAITCVLFLLVRQHFELQVLNMFIPKLAASQASMMGRDLFHMILFVFGISIVIGATAERLRFWPLILFSIFMLLVVYPMEAFWVWGGGFLQKLEFIDQGGASVIHLNSAMLALAGLTILGHRNGKYDRMNESLPLPGANIPLSTLGVALLWVGFIGLNLLAVLFADKNFAVNQVYIVVFNTLLAGSVGLLSSIFFSRVIFGTIDLTLVFNGLLASLVMITAQPAMSSHAHVIIAAMIATILTMVLLFILDKLRIDDPIGVIASQTAGSLVGLVAVAFDAENLARQVGIQLMGSVSIIIYSFAVGYLLWWLVRLTMGLRIKPEDEYKGLDVTGCGMVAYPEFTSTNWEK